MRIDSKFLVPVAMLAVVLVGGAYAFVALTVTTTVNIGEPLSIVSVVGTGDLSVLTCSSVTALTATCSLTVTAGALGGVDVKVHNSGSQALTVTGQGTETPLQGTTATFDFDFVNPSSASVSAGGDSTFSFSVTVHPDAIPGTETFTLQFSR